MVVGTPDSSSGPPPSVDGGAAPGDLAMSAGTPLVAAHSLTRAMYASYHGRLFQVRRGSDSKTQDISVTSSGLVDLTSLNSFISGTTGYVSILYDQSGNGNDLPQATAGNQPTIGFWSRADGTMMPMAVSVSRQYLRNRTNTKLIPTGAQSMTEYFVVNTKHFNADCCYDYGNMESKVESDGNGTMAALNIGTKDNGFSAPGAGSGPWAMVDFESGVYTGPNRIGVVNPNAPSLTWDVAMALTKSNGTTSWIMKVSDATKGTLTTTTSAGLPPGYSPLKLEGGLSLGEGGDGHSTLGAGAFFEGVIIAAVTADATDDAIQANLVSVYGK